MFIIDAHSTNTTLLPFFFFNDTATTEIYTLSLHDALPIYLRPHQQHRGRPQRGRRVAEGAAPVRLPGVHLRQRGHRLRSEEHTSELQSRQYLVCRLLLEKKKTDTPISRMPLSD